MVRVGKFLVYLLFFITMVLYFLPKENLYFLLEQELAKKEIFISNEEIKEKAFGLELQNATISYEGIEAAQLKSLDINLFLLYNSLDLQEIELSSLIANYWPQKIQECHLSYSILSPLQIEGVAQGVFGTIEAHYMIKEATLTVILHPSKIMLKKYRSTLRYFKKLKNGEYSYEKSL